MPYHREELLREFEKEVNQTAEIYVDGVEKRSRFFEWVDANNIPWPKKRDGSRSWANDVMKDCEHLHPFIALLRQAKKSRKAFSDRDGFLSAVQVNEAGHLARIVFPFHPHLEFANGFEAPVGIE